MSTHIIHCDQLFDGEHVLLDQAVFVAKDRIQTILPASELEPGRITQHADVMVPGLIDLQVNGGGGVLFNEAPALATLQTISQAHRRFGTTGFLPTLISDRKDVIAAAIDAVAAAIAEGVPGVLGIHLEGPCLNQARKGVHDAERFFAPVAEDIALFSSLKAGRTLVTLAPEVVGNEAVRALVARGVIVSGGHSEADYEQTTAALSAGMRGFTHLFNAMPPMLSREPGMVGAALARDDSWFGIIADGHHVHPAVFRAAVRAKPAGGAILVTDAMSTVGAPETSFRVAQGEVSLSEGRLLTPVGTLAGSHLNMLDAVKNASKYADIDWFEAQRMASLYPARALGLQNELGMLRAGYRASFLLLDAQRQLQQSWVDGQRYGITSA